MKKHPLIDTLLTAKGNPRACLYTEPLWTIPYFLYIPFVSVYMAALGLSDSQIGIVASVTMFCMAIAALVSGAITDKLGRRRTTLIFDILSWSIPCLLWAFSQNFWWFIFAAAFNGLMQVTTNSWTCLLVEDAQKNAMVRIFSLLYVIGQLSVIFAPIAAVLIDRFSIVPVMRALYLFSFVSMTIKFIILYRWGGETDVGRTRMRETAHMSIMKIMSGYGQVFKRIISSANMKTALAINAILYITTMIVSNFFGLYITGTLLIQEHILAYYPIVRSVIIVLFMFIIQPRLQRFGFKLPMLLGTAVYISGLIVLLISPVQNQIMPFVYIFIEACAFSLVQPTKESLVVLLIDKDERARISSIMTFLMLCVSMPFGYFAGWLSDMNRQLPFMLTILLFVLVFAVILLSSKQLKEVAEKHEE